MKARMITYTDYNRLMDQLYCDLENKSVSPSSLHHLYLLLETAKKISEKNLPENIITMNSRVIIRFIKTGIRKNITIIYPSKNIVWFTKESVSIYDPLGQSIIGCREKEILDYNPNRETGDDKQEILIEKVLFQPEAFGLYIL